MEHRALVIASVIEAGAFLESMINEVFKDCADGHLSYLAPLPPDVICLLQSQWTFLGIFGRKTIPTLDKYDVALQCCTRNRLPLKVYTDARDLLDLRIC